MTPLKLVTTLAALGNSAVLVLVFPSGCCGRLSLSCFLRSKSACNLLVPRVQVHSRVSPSFHVYLQSPSRTPFFWKPSKRSLPVPVELLHCCMRYAHLLKMGAVAGPDWPLPISSGLSPGCWMPMALLPGACMEVSGSAIVDSARD